MFLQKLKIGNKLALLMIMLSLVVIAVLSSLFYFQFDAALSERVQLQLSSVKQLKIVKIRNELSDRISEFANLKDSIYQNDQFSYIWFGDSIPEEVDGLPIRSLILPGKELLQILDLTPYMPEQQISVALVGQRRNGYLIAIAPLPEVQEILLERTGLGQTGETYLVGADHRMRSKSRFFNGNPLNIVVKTVGVERALGDDPGEGLFLDYRNVEVFSSYEKLEMYGLEWVVLSEIDHQEAFFPLKKLRANFVVFLLIILGFVLVVSYQLSRVVVKPILAMEKQLIKMSRGVFSGGVTESDAREDEIGQMFRALNKLIKALEDTIVFADKIGSGDFEAAYVPLSHDDKLGEALIHMQNKLKEFQEKERQLIRENQKSILSGEEKERSRLSKEMHDGLGPLLTTLRMSLQSVELDDNTKNHLLHRLDETITEVRRMSNNLMPSVLSDFGAGEAISNLVAYIRQHSEIKILFKNDMRSESDIGSDTQIALYRIAQESINNALKHSEASELKISITEFEDHIDYFISDNGKGFDQNTVTHGNGLRNMKERVKLANGLIEIDSGSHGTTIEIQIPIT